MGEAGPLEELTADVDGLAAVSARVFEVVGPWAPETEDDELAVRFAVVSRDLGEHVAWWRQVCPESVLLAPHRPGRVPDAVADLVDALAALGGDAARAAGLHWVVLPVLAARCRALDARDAAVRRVRDRVLVDLTDALVEGAAPTARTTAADPAALAAVAGLLGPAARASRP